MPREKILSARLICRCGANNRAMKSVPFWIDSAPIPTFPKLQSNINVGVLVVGAGITAITTAYLLKNTGSTVAMIERERVALIDTGPTPAHLTYVTDVPLHSLPRKYGEANGHSATDP